ncbi:hypothetical protein EG329_002796 [Mollisiaceae sp. DMI_Dod_QoI]|nr:hypothetical protein EG329_002796 [Helotiales sp. DMI_Dod_QoI]
MASTSTPLETVPTAPAALSKHRDFIIEKVQELTTLPEDMPQMEDDAHARDSRVTTSDLQNPQASASVAGTVSSPQEMVHSSKISLVDLPPELLELLCTEYLDTVTCTSLGLTCKAIFNITEHLYPHQVNLHMRTSGPDKKCLGHLLTDWMAPMYAFDHSWGKFLRKKHYLNNEAIIERRWGEKESWIRIKLVVDKYGAAVAYESSRGGF